MVKVLIIEDEPNMVLGLKDSCEYEGYEVSVARDGKEGLEKASTGETRHHSARCDAAFDEWNRRLPHLAHTRDRHSDSYADGAESRN